ncbi:MAG: phosphocholine cytidylyltransferase family protein [Candidatus Tectomicrobia bacterium]
MRAIIIGAGRGQRLEPLTDDSHKTLTEIKGKRIIDWILAALTANGIDDIVYIAGFNQHVIRAAFPQFTYVHNRAWETNNILASLMCAEHLMDTPFVSTYCDILYTPAIVRHLVAAEADIALGVDTHWLEHYRYRTQHPPTDAEKVTVQDGWVTKVNRGLSRAESYGEFIGVAKFTPSGARQLREHYHRCKQRYVDTPFRNSPRFEQAMLIHLLDEMLEQGVRMAHVDTPGDYREIDTHEDRALAEQFWRCAP